MAANQSESLTRTYAVATAVWLLITLLFTGALMIVAPQVFSI
ncbi:MAG: hypothetical protein ABEJ08_05665 [Halobacteriaceae archaeon]